MPIGEPDLSGTIIAVSWEDAHYNMDEVDGSETTHRPWIYVSVGVRIKSDEVGVTVGMDIGEDGKFRGRTFIPRRMVLDEWVVGPVKPKRKRASRSPVVKDLAKEPPLPLEG